MADPLVDVEASPEDDHVNLRSSGDNQTDMALSSRLLHVHIIGAAVLFTNAVIMALKWLDIQRTVPRQHPNNADSPDPVSSIPPAAIFCLSMVLGFNILLKPYYSRYLRGLWTRLEVRKDYWRYGLLYTWWMVRYINWYMKILLFKTHIYVSENVRHYNDLDSSTHVSR